MKVLVTGAAGFIGFHLTKRLLELGHNVVGLDNINDYYDVNLKYARLSELGIGLENAKKFLTTCKGEKFKDLFKFVRMNLEDRENLPKLFKEQQFDIICNLAAQAGVRYSLENPETYIDSNIVGFLNILECCRNNKIKHLVYASSSSVYGANASIPFSEKDKADSPLSLYAATKKSNELMGYTYSHLYDLPTTGLRFFTVYGPWGRPDMAPMLFADAISNKRQINVFNYGDMERDFTYIDDIVEGVKRVIEKPIGNRDLYKIYNIGNNKSIKLLDFIAIIEKKLAINAEKILLPIQPGDVRKTWAGVDDLILDYDYKPNTTLEIGLSGFIEWFLSYFKPFDETK